MATKKETTSRYKTYTKKIGETEYVGQFSGFSMKYDMADYATDFKNGNQYLSTKRIATYLLENVIVDPKVTLDDFENSEELDEVIEFARLIVEGKKPNTFQE